MAPDEDNQLQSSPTSKCPYTFEISSIAFFMTDPDYIKFTMRIPLVPYLCLLLSTSFATADLINEHEASNRAMEWMASNPIMSQHDHTIRSVEAYPETGYQVYILNLAPSGYMVVNSDDALDLIVCYSPTSRLNLSDSPNNAFRSMLRQRIVFNRDRLSQLPNQASKKVATKNPPSLHTASETEILGPYLETSWSQWAPYNDLSPTACPSGCVMTATAQILKYHNWPRHGTGSASYTDDQGSTTGSHSADFSDDYDWDNMLTNYPYAATYSTAEADAVSELMYELAVIAEADFETDGTSASTFKIRDKIPDYLYYEPCDSNDFSASNDEIISMMEADLRAGLPCLVSIPNHAVVADGLMVSNGVSTYHFNYGWGGTNDGWWTWDNITDNGTAINSIAQSIIPQLIAFPEKNQIISNPGASIELTWIFPKHHREEAATVTILEEDQSTWEWTAIAKVDASSLQPEDPPTLRCTLPSLSTGEHILASIVTDQQGNEHRRSPSFKLIVGKQSEMGTPPELASIDNKTIDEGTTLTFSASATDVDLPKQSLFFSLKGAPEGASINSSTGAFSWTPTESQGPDTYTITIHVSDGFLSDTEAFNVIVNETNQPPVLPTIGNLTVDEGSALSFSAAANDPDIPEQALTYELINAPEGASINYFSGDFTWVPKEGLGDTTHTFSIKVSDGIEEVVKQITVTVKKTNRAPVLEQPSYFMQTAEMRPFSYQASASDPDLPVQSLSFSLVNPPSGASIDSESGLFTWTPSENQGPESYDITIQVSDGLLSDSKTFSLQVAEANRAPSLSYISNQAIDEGSRISFTATATDPDIPAQFISFSLKNAPDGANIDPFSGLFNWIPSEDQGPHSHTFTIVASDGDASDSQEITISVREVNQAPILAHIGNKTVQKTTPLSFFAIGTDPDIPASLTHFSYTLLDGPEGASIDPMTGAFSWAPTEEQSTHSFTANIEVSDGSLTDSQEFSIYVAENDEAPLLDPIGNQNIDELSTLSFTASASYSDSEENTLNFSLYDAPQGAHINPSSGAFTWTPTETQGPATYTFSVQVTDSTFVDSEEITVIVNEVNQAPALQPIQQQYVDEGMITGFSASADDADYPTQPLTYSIINAPQGSSFNTVTGAFTWTPTTQQGEQLYSFTISVSDGTLSNSQEVFILVKDPKNLPPPCAYWISDQDGTPNLYRAFWCDGTAYNTEQITFLKAPQQLLEYHFDKTNRQLGLIIASSDTPGETRLYLANSDGSNLRQISDLNIGPQFDFSPDGDEIIFTPTDDDQTVYKMSLNNGFIDTLLEASEPHGFNSHKTALSWINSNSIIFSDTYSDTSFKEGQDLYLWNYDTVNTLSSNTSNGEKDALPSPDGSRLLLQTMTSNTYGLAYIRWPEDDGLNPIFNNSSTIRIPSGWVDNSTIAYSQNGDIYFYNLDTLTETKWTHSPTYTESHFKLTYPDDSAAMSWLSKHLPENTPLVERAFDADPDKDGIPNLVEYAIGLEPGIADSAGAFTIQIDSQTHAQSLSLRCQTKDPSLHYVLERSSDLLLWNKCYLYYDASIAGWWSSDPIFVEVQSATNIGNDTWNLSLSINHADAPNFIRLNVSTDPF